VYLCVKPWIIKIVHKFLLAVSFAIIGSSAAQEDSLKAVFKRTYDELHSRQRAVFFTSGEKQRFEANRDFLQEWEKIIHHPYALQYPLDSLKEVSVLTSADHKVRLITWNIPKDDGTHFYFGFLLVNTVKRIKKGFLRYEKLQAYDAYRLVDRSATVKSPEGYIGSPDKWFGMLYTKMITCDGYFTLLGWDGNDKLTQRKFIDVLSFRPDGSPVFGKDVFKFPRKNPKRIMFEYSSDVSMSLRYNESNGQIVFSHLSSRQDGGNLEGQFQFYGPDGSYDAFVPKGDRWILTEDIDARNEKNKNDHVNKPDPRKQTPIYKPK
jgi:hypothetical protein